MWIWICVAIVVVGLLVHVLLGLRVWRDVKELFAAMAALEWTIATLERELQSIQSTATNQPLRPRHGIEVEPRA